MVWVDVRKGLKTGSGELLIRFATGKRWAGFIRGVLMIKQSIIPLTINRGHSISGVVGSQDYRRIKTWLPHAETPTHQQRPVSF